MLKLSKHRPGVDKPFLFLILLLCGLGLFAVADASAPQALSYFGDELYFFKQQAMWAVLGIAVMTVVSFVKYTFWEKFATPLFFMGLISLVIVLIPGFGLSALGARRWIELGPISFQPSELIKLALALYIAKVAAKGKGALSYFVPVGIVAVLIMIQPDLGTTLVVVGEVFLQIFVSGVSLLYFTVAGFASAGIALILILTSEYRRARLFGFFESTSDPLAGTYHIRQILLGLGSGGVFGIGLGHSRQKYLFLPEAATDSIFAVLAEELGFVGSVVVISLFAYFIFKGIQIAEKVPDKFGKVLAMGVVGWIGTQAFLNIGSMVALVPITGVPLPFISYGGTSLITVLFATGILLNISRYGKLEHSDRPNRGTRSNHRNINGRRDPKTRVRLGTLLDRAKKGNRR